MANIYRTARQVLLVWILCLPCAPCTGIVESAELSQYGNYTTQMKRIALRRVLDRSDPRAVVVYPKQVTDDSNQRTFPLLVFAHGFMAGGAKTYAIHRGLLDGLASFGFIVVAPQSCNWGCPGFGRWTTYDDEILTLLNFAVDSEDHPIFKFVDRDAGYGILGHSAGGRAAAQALQVAQANNVKAGVILHPVGDDVNISVPTAVFTGTEDDCCGESAARRIYSGVTSSSKAYADMIGGAHIEPNFATDWTAHVAAWFHIHLSSSTNNNDSFYRDLIYGNTGNSLCSPTSVLPMKEETCEALP